MATITDYQGRLIDLSVFDGAEADHEVLLTPRLMADGEGGKIITGVAKLAQRVVMKLLTVQGSMPYDPEEGTQFLARFRSQEIHTQLDAEQAMQSALLDVKRQLGQEETADQSADEKLQAINLVSVVYLISTVIFRLQIISQAGSTRPILLPLATTSQGA